MRSYKGKYKIRSVAGIMGIMMLFIMLFSVAYPVAEYHHECRGENCHICECIELCDTILGRMADVPDAILAAVCIFIIYTLSVSFFQRVQCSDTPVTRKIRLND